MGIGVHALELPLIFGKGRLKISLGGGKIPMTHMEPKIWEQRLSYTNVATDALLVPKLNDFSTYEFHTNDLE